MTEQINSLNARINALISANEGKHINEINRADLEEVARLRAELASAWQLQHAYRVEELADLKEVIYNNFLSSK